MSNARVLVIGGGLSGLVAGRRLQRTRPDAEVVVVEREPLPGGDARTQRSNGFGCELGAFAFCDDELAPMLAALERPPRVIAARAGAERGWLFDGGALHAIDVDPPPRSFASGCTELVQALRRELGASLQLGRAVTSLQPRDGGGFDVALGGEAATRSSFDEVVFATSPLSAAPLLAAFEPRLAFAAEQAPPPERRAFVFFGGLQKDCEDLRGYGVLTRPDVGLPVAEVIYCSNVFAQRAIGDRFLLRAELTCNEPAHDDRALTAAVEQHLRACTGTTAPFGFQKVHRFVAPLRDGLATECRARFHEIVQRVPGMSRAD